MILRNFAGNAKVNGKPRWSVYFLFITVCLETINQNMEKMKRRRQKITPFSLWLTDLARGMGVKLRSYQCVFRTISLQRVDVI